MTSKQTAGQRLTADILADLDAEDLEPDSREMELLTRAAVAADRIEQLEAVVAREGSTFVNAKTGVTWPSPLLAEIRLQDAVLTRNLRGIGMEAKNEAGKNAAKSRAGHASWRARQARNIPSVGIA